MSLRNLNFDSAVRGILEQKPANCDGLLTQASEQLTKCKLSADLHKAVTAPRVVRRGPEKGRHVGSENFNARAIGEWIENIPDTVPDVDPSEPASQEVAEAVKTAHEQLVAIHATLATRSPATWAKIQVAQKASKPVEPAPLV